jgi:hypothetical protein
MQVVDSQIKKLHNLSWGGKHHLYTQPHDYSYVTPFIFYKTEDLINTISKDESNDKWVIFVTGVDKGKSLEKLIPKSKFVKSGFKKDIREIVESNTFKEKVKKFEDSCFS